MNLKRMMLASLKQLRRSGKRKVTRWHVYVHNSHMISKIHGHWKVTGSLAFECRSYSFDGIRMPPSNLITTPLSIGFSTLSLTILENSSGLPGRRGNSMTLVRLFLTLSLISAVMPLSNKLGATVTTRIPY